MRILVLLLSLLAAAPAFASTHAENLEKCRLIDKLPYARQRIIARSVGSTVEAIKAACRSIRQPARPTRPSRSSRPAPKQEPTPSCNCGPGEVCVRRYFTYECEFYASSGNRCSIQSDCFGNSRCENGSCTR